MRGCFKKRFSSLFLRKGNATLFVIITLFTLMVASASGRLTVLSVALVRNANSFLHATIKDFTRQSAFSVLEFSCIHDIPLQIELNGFEIESFKKSGVWYVRLEDKNSSEVHACALCISGAH
ncbi:MAG TPA: hypothetical protein DCE14_00300 [Kosmotogaceae bacterium]|nr:hypothetical protein [Kosmotogaceae bacterium]